MRVRTVLEVTTRNGEAITRSKNVKGKIVNGRHLLADGPFERQPVKW